MLERDYFAPWDAVVSRIDGMFTGWDGSSVFRLRNGQSWQQSAYSCLRHYAYAPAVRIRPAGDGYELLVEGVGATIPVRRVW